MSANRRMAPARAIARHLGLIHNTIYYAPEVQEFRTLGLDHYWRAYMAWRCAPLGAVGPHAATAILYNFAPQRVAESFPSAWETTDPAEVLGLRDSVVNRALQRGLGDLVASSAVVEAADLALAPMGDVDPAGRALFGAHADLEVPDEPWMRLWHGATLWREFRGDSHNIALAAAGVDGIEAHVLLVARGVGTAASIQKLRGWTPTQWSRAVERLQGEGLVDAAEAATQRGRDYRNKIEEHTDLLSREPRDRLGDERLDRLIELVAPIASHLVDVGAVAARWPPDPTPGPTPGPA